MHNSEDLIRLFDDCFFHSYRTRLVRGQDEPIYLPQTADRPWHEIQFAHGFFNSALHEVAHWLIAGAARRQLVDYGYWYAPDGRSEVQQMAFEQVEVKPQALEWIMACAAGTKFRLSLDNLTGDLDPQSTFRQAVCQQARNYCRNGLGDRASQFRAALCDFYGTSLALDSEQFQLQDL